MSNMLKHVTYTLGLVAMVAPAMGAEWMSDFEAAKAKAAEEGKAILINFTGSDWCGYCIRMKQQILDTPAFEEYVKDNFVLLEVDIPRRKQVDASEMQKRRELCRHYEVSGFPTIVITTETGELLGGVAGGQSTMEGMSIYLDNALIRRNMLTEARKLQGEARAKALMEVYKDYPKSFRRAAAALRQEILECDPNDTTGLKEISVAEEQMQALMDEIAQNRRDFGRMCEIFDSYIAKAHPRNKERMMERKRDIVVFPCVNLMLRHATSVEDIQKARDYVLQQAETSYPDNIKAEMIESLKKTFANPEAMLEDLNRRRNKR